METEEAKRARAEAPGSHELCAAARVAVGGREPVGHADEERAVRGGAMSFLRVGPAGGGLGRRAPRLVASLFDCDRGRERLKEQSGENNGEWGGGRREGNSPKEQQIKKRKR